MKGEVNAPFSSDEETESNFDNLYTNNNAKLEEISNKTSSLCVKDRKRKNTARKAKRSVKDEENHHLLVAIRIRAGITMSNRIACLRGIILAAVALRTLRGTRMHLCLTQICKQFPLVRSTRTVMHCNLINIHICRLFQIHRQCLVPKQSQTRCQQSQHQRFWNTAKYHNIFVTCN